MNKSIAVLGLGEYGISLVRALNEMGVDVLAVDRDETKLKEIADFCTAALCADFTNEESMASLGLKDMDIVVVAVGDNLEASLFAVASAKEQGVPLIVAKSSSERMSMILKKIGADKVIMPEEYAGMRSAALLASETVLEYFQVDDRLCMIEMLPLADWVGNSLTELRIRNNYDVNVVAIKGADDNWVMTKPEQPIREKDKLLVVVERSNLGRLRDK